MVSILNRFYRGSSKSNADSGRCVGIDLSSSSKSGANDSNSMMDEVQDFSMSSKSRHNQFQQPASMSSSYQQSQSQVAPSKSKLDDMLTKLMQKKNCVSVTTA